MRRIFIAAAALLCALPAWAAGGFNQDSFGKPGFSQFVAATTGSMIQPVMSVFNLPSSGSTAQFGGMVGFYGAGSLGTAATTRGVPLPAAGNITGLYANLATTQVGAAVIDNITPSTNVAADGTLGCSIPSTAPPGANCSDNHSDAVAAGDILNWHWTVSGTWTQAASGAPQQAAFLFVPTDGKTGILLGGAQTNPSIIGTVTDQYATFGAGSQTSGGVTVEANGEVVANEPITITGLFAQPNATTNATTAQVVALCVNGAGCAGNPTSGMFCPFTVSSRLGCCVQVSATGHVPGGSASCGTTTAISLNAGDSFSLHIFCGNTANCATIAPGFSVSYTPSVPGHAMLVASSFSTWITINSIYLNFNDGAGVTNSQVNYGITPFLNGKTMTLSNLMLCSSVALTGTQTRTVTSQAATTPGTTPATTEPTTVTLNNGSGGCGLGGNAALVAGGQDTTHSWSAGSGYSVDNVLTATNIATGNALAKASMTAVIQ